MKTSLAVLMLAGAMLLLARFLSAQSAPADPVGCPIIGQAPVQGQVQGQEQGLATGSATTAGPAYAVDADGSACTATETSSACAAPGAGSAVALAGGDVLGEDLERVVAHLQDIREACTSGTIRLDAGELEQTLGFRPDRKLLTEAVSIVFPEAAAGGGMSRCSDYGACSLYGDLASAKGDVLSMYEDEKAQDGRSFDEFPLPTFSARTLAGEQVSSDELRGKPTLLVPMAVHCSHSYDTLPILHDLAHEYGPQGLRVVGLLINSGSPEDATQSLSGSPACHDFWVTEGDTVGKLMQSRLVPSHFLVSADGRVVKKFVGFKNADELATEIESLLGA